MASFSYMYVTLICVIIPTILAQVTEFISIDCGGTGNYIDNATGLAWISDNGIQRDGASVRVSDATGNAQQYYQTRRDFPTDSNKYCYTLTTEERRRYIIRATFLYGTSVNGGAFPKFQLYLDATKWSTVTVLEASRTYVKEMIIRAPSHSVDVCLCCATTGSPFISTLEMRPLNLSMYATDYEDQFYMKVAARVNFGAPNQAAIRLTAFFGLDMSSIINGKFKDRATVNSNHTIARPTHGHTIMIEDMSNRCHNCVPVLA